jgi:ParB family chromosome partitioning protein
MFGKTDTTKKFKRTDSHTQTCEKEISQRLGFHATVKKMSKGGKITIRFKSLDELDNIVERFKEIPKSEKKE